MVRLKPSDYDSNGDIIPDAVKGEGDFISRSALKATIEFHQLYVNPKLSVDDVLKLIDLL